MARSSDPRGTARTGRPEDYDDGTSGASASIGDASDNKVISPELGIRGYLRWFWRQLTSMRVALILLLLLAVATIPGSLVPQRAADPNGVVQYQQDHPDLFKVLDAFPIQAFDVYSSVWFSAIYLLLFISLIGCVLPRIAHHWKALRGTPPRTPARLQRMAGYAEQRISNPQATPEERQEFSERAILEAEKLLRGQHYRVEIQRAKSSKRSPSAGAEEISVSAERGYLRETGNLLFHIALVGVLVSVAIGGMFSFNGQRVLVEGESFVNQLIDYDSANSGTYFSPTELEPFTMKLNDFEVDYITDEDGNDVAVGQVSEYRANVTLTTPDGQQNDDVIRVNHPLRVHGSPVYLLANGYAPTVTIRNAEGEVVYSESMPFIPQEDLNLTSLGVLKVPYGISRSGEPTQVGLRGFFYPTQAKLDTGAYTSIYPDLKNPVLTLDVFVGDLGIDSGIAQSVYKLDTDNMEQLTGRAVDKKSLELDLGETLDLPDNMGTISFENAPRYAAFDVMYNPAQMWILISALAAVLGLLSSLFVPRRRMWVKAVQSEDGVVLQYAALARGDDPALERAVEVLREQHRERL
ncbi:cytochrome c biogenesis protein ResB [Leucobacter sp. UT-8R-CII-1-4]|uniref:cytochrome c biogenesis protein ResB n=1 Tax=Leucobacter sp. UT-8R-CII-1-4 TaxID=3040075 RepID=UPI0024A90AAB|nr:cytochrome c biogenesis protein ResB [Leucobacter sp. UT-8R-CII-1-4]MDI6023718.1 cytochrome c biogenesis protein ResB [Leucobacter sp. UT-8R-CII-1-4]